MQHSYTGADPEFWKRGAHSESISVHDITGDIKCIIAVRGNFNAC